jgi:tetratricopeptide (TPR) repeat protein
MKKILLSTLLATACFIGSLSAQDAFEVQMKAYKLALKNYDLSAATNSVYVMMALKPERVDLNDSLALLYFAGERYGQAYIIGEEILKANPNRKDMLELVAVSKQNLGMVKESLADYEKLYAGDKGIYYLYQIATLQYQLKRYGECVASLDQIINNPESAQQKVNIMLQGGSQDVPMKAAALNVKGICALELNQEDAAKDNFNKALEVYPDFVLPKGNLDMIAKQKAQAKPASTTTTAPKPATTTTKPATAPK